MLKRRNSIKTITHNKISGFKVIFSVFFPLTMSKVPHKELEKQKTSKISPQKSLNIQKGTTDYNNLLHTKFEYIYNQKKLETCDNKKAETF